MQIEQLTLNKSLELKRAGYIMVGEVATIPTNTINASVYRMPHGHYAIYKPASECPPALVVEWARP